MYRRHCDQCGKWYEGRGAKFCDRSCRTLFRNLTDNPAKSPQARAKIGKSRRGKPTTTGRVTPQSQRDNIAASLRGRTLPEEQKQKIRATLIRIGHRPDPNLPVLRGPDHPSWKGGTRPARQADYRNPAYVAFRKTVLERDDWTCQDCGTRGGRLEVHHIKSWAEHPDLRYEPDNGMTLCRSCHNRTKTVPRPRNAGPRTLAELRSSQT